MRTLVIPDIHDKSTIARRIVERVPHDRVAFLGDFFDDFHTGVDDAKTTAEFLRECLRDSSADVLLGNHDLHYGWSENRDFRSSGFSPAKCDAIREVVSWDDWQRFKLRVWMSGPDVPGRGRPLLLTHAGIDWSFIPDGFDPIVVVDELCDAALKSLQDPIPQQRGKGHAILGAGIDRSGPQRKGGLLWCDWNNLDMPPGIDQILGHTPWREPRVHDRDQAIGVCLDTHLKHYGVIEDGMLTVKRTDALSKISNLPLVRR